MSYSSTSTNSSTKPEDRRRAVRVSKSLEFYYSAECRPIQARLDDLSEAGAFVDTSHPLTVGSLVDFKFQLPDESSGPIEGRGRVAWVSPMVGVGLEFQNLKAEDRERIKFYVAGEFFARLTV